MSSHPAHLSPDRPTLVLLDGTAMLFRAFYGMGDFTTRDGRPIGGVIGAGQSIIKALRLLQSPHVAVVFDMAPQTFRNELFPAYKANRGDPPEALIPQFEMVREMVDVLGFRSFGIVGFEADDMMGTLSSLATQAGMDCVMVNVDKDLLQLVRDEEPSIRLYDLTKNRWFDEAAVTEHIGFPPARVVDYLAIVGDSSDNIPGLKGVGPKTAKALLDAYPSVQEIYENLDAIPTLAVRGAKSLAKKLEAGRDDLALFQQLVTLRKDAPVDVSVTDIAEATRWQGPTTRAQGFFESIGGFRHILRRLHDLARPSTGAVPYNPDDDLPSIEDVDDLPW